MVFDRTRNKVFLAPMAGVADAAFRQIAIELGAGFTYTEMASAKGIKYGSAKTKELISPASNEDAFGVQLFGRDPSSIAGCIETISAAYSGRIALFDINMGCPAPKITGNGEGCALMKDIPLASKIIKKAVSASPLPVTVKFRKGWDEQSVNAVEFAKMAQDSGAAAVTVHGRTRQQFYSGKADRQIIAEVKKAVKIPVVGNGDIFSADDAVQMFETTGCDAVMVARGALGNPFIFREILERLDGREILTTTPEEKASILLEQAELCAGYKGERLAMLQMRKHAAWYIKGIKGASKFRESAVMIKTLNDLKELISCIWSDSDVKNARI